MYARPPSQPPTLDERAVGPLFDHVRVPTLGVVVHVLIVVVQAGDVAEPLDAPDRVGQGVVAAALRIGRQVVRMAAVITAFGPSAKDEQAAGNPQVFVQVLGDLRRLVERPPDLDRLLLRAVLAHAPGQAGPKLDVRRPEHRLGMRVASHPVAHRHGQSLLLGQAAVGSGERVPIATADGRQTDRPGGTPKDELAGDPLPIRLVLDQHALHFGEHVGIVPTDHQSRPAFEQAEHVHVAAFVVRRAEGVLEGHAAVGRNQEPLAARHHHAAGLLVGHGQGVVQHADVAQFVAFVAKDQRTAVVDKFKHHRGAVLLDHSYGVGRGGCFADLAFEPLGRSEAGGSFRGPAHIGRFVQQGPGARLGVHLDRERGAFQAERGGGKGDGVEQ